MVVTLRDALGAEVATIAAKSWKRAGQHTVRFDPLEVPDGLFRVDLLAVATGGASGNRLDPARHQPHAWQHRRHTPRVLTERRRLRRSDRLQLRACRPGRDPGADPETGQVGGDAVQGPARAGSAQDRVGRREAGRPAAGRGVRGGGRGNGRVRDHDRDDAVQCRHPCTQGQDPPAQPAEALAQRAGDGDAALRHAAACLRTLPRPARRASRMRRSWGSSGRSPGTRRATKARLPPGANRKLGGCNRLRSDPVQSIRTFGPTARWSTRN